MSMQMDAEMKKRSRMVPFLSSGSIERGVGGGGSLRDVHPNKKNTHVPFIIFRVCIEHHVQNKCTTVCNHDQCVHRPPYAK